MQCIQQYCLTDLELGPARAAKTMILDCKEYTEGEIIDPLNHAATVTIDELYIEKVIIVSKEPNPFRSGFWDIDLKYVFRYNLILREAGGTVIGTIPANSIYNKSVTLFGSIGTDIVLASDLFNGSPGFSTTLNADPFVLVEAKAVALKAELKYSRHCNGSFGIDSIIPEPNLVNVTIGLFTIIKLFRIVQLSVQSNGFCIPPVCEEISPLNPCEFFDGLDFPMDIFAPPQKKEFLAGISENIPAHRDTPCGCDD